MDDVVNNLAQSAAEKRAQFGFRLGPSMMMNPYMGGMGFGRGRFGMGMMGPMMFAGGPGGYYAGMHPAFMRPLQQRMQLANLGLMYGLPQIQARNIAAQTAALGALQNQPALQFQRQLAERGAEHAFRDQPLGEQQLRAMEQQIAALRARAAKQQELLGERSKSLRALEDPFIKERAATEEALGRFGAAGGTLGALEWARRAARRGDSQARKLLIHLGHTQDPGRGGLARLGGLLQEAFGDTPEEYTKALQAFRKLETLKERREAALATPRSALEEARTSLGLTRDELAELQQKYRERTLAIQQARQRAGEAAIGRREPAFRGGLEATRKLTDVATREAARPTIPGTLPRRPTPAPAPPTTAVPTPPATIPKQPRPPTAPQAPVPRPPTIPPLGLGGGRGPGSVKQASVVAALADNAACIAIEKAQLG